MGTTIKTLSALLLLVLIPGHALAGNNVVPVSPDGFDVDGTEIPINCHSPMARITEKAFIEQGMNAADQDIHITRIQALTPSVRAKSIGNGKYSLKCGVSVWWSDNTVNQDWIFIVWQGNAGALHFSYLPADHGVQ